MMWFIAFIQIYNYLSYPLIKQTLKNRIVLLKGMNIFRKIEDILANILSKMGEKIKINLCK